MSNTFGNIFRITTYGESHGPAVGVVIDGCPAGVAIDLAFIQAEMDKRKPGQSAITTDRKEADQVQIISGVYEGITTGTPIHLMIENTNVKSEDYDTFKNTYRPSHADYTYEFKYGLRDHRGGGRSSARETACRVAAGAIAKIILRHFNIKQYTYVSKVGNLLLNKPYTELNLDNINNNIIRCPDESKAAEFIRYIEEIKAKGDSVGGVITSVIQGAPAGLGEPIYRKFHAALGAAMLSINAVHGFDYGSGYAGTDLLGSSHNDAFVHEGGGVQTETNHSGGIQGGITNGMDIYFTVAFKPTATIAHTQNTIDKDGNTITLSGKGRHDPCVLPRAVPIVEAMAALVLVDFILLNQSAQFQKIIT